VLNLEVFIFKFATVDAFAACAIMLREVSCLDHKIGNHSVEHGVFVRELAESRRQRALVLALLGHSFASAECAEVETGLGAHVAIQTNCHAPSNFAAYCDVHVALFSDGEIRRHILACEEVVPLLALGLFEVHRDAAAQFIVGLDLPDAVITLYGAPQLARDVQIFALDAKV